MMQRMVALFLVFGSTVTPVLGQFPWFPEEVRAGLQQTVAEKLLAIDESGSISPERAGDAGRVAVEGVAAKLESLGRQRTIEMAPSFADLGVQSSGRASLDAIAAYQLCSLPFDVSYLDDSPRENRYDMRAWSLFLSTAVFVASTYLRPAYLEAGLTDEEAQAWLYSESMTGLKTRIRASGDLLRSTQERCADPLVTLLQ